VRKAEPVFLANSRAGRRFLADTFGLNHEDVTVIPNAYAVDANAPVAPRAPVRARELSLIHVANFYPEKDYDTLLQGMHLLSLEGLAWRLHLCGEFLFEHERLRFLEQVRDLGLQDRVVHLGPTSREEVLARLSESDLGLLSSRSEGQPNSVMEYMYAGLPVVGTRIEGIQELVGERNEPWLFDVGDAQGLARSIRALAADPALRSEIGRLNRLRIVEHYALERVLPRWAAIVEGPSSIHEAADEERPF
jgi:glycosyltransferase involved in cell wall biosynthesis